MPTPHLLFRAMGWFLGFLLLLIIADGCSPATPGIDDKGNKPDGIQVVTDATNTGPDAERLTFLDGNPPTDDATPPADDSTPQDVNPSDTPPPETDPAEGSADKTNLNCVESECVSPPNSVCLDGSNVRIYNAKGSCHPQEDKCTYGYTDTACPNAGVCRSGQCFAKDDPCTGLACDKPYPAKCTNASTLRTYSLPGTCKNQVCNYESKDQNCPHGCASGKCKPDPCAGVSCNKKPASKCVNSTTVRNYYLPGKCSGGSCSYSYADQKCPHGCASGKCKVGSGFTALNPFRFLDTRGAAVPGTDSTRCVKISGKGGVPTGARAVYINLVAVAPTGQGFLTAYPKGISRPNVSTLNYGTGQTIANGSIIKLGTNGEICVFVKTPTHMIIDVYGYFASDSDFFPTGPYRRLDTRSGTAPANDSTQCHKIAGRNNIPTSAKAVFVNFAVVNASGPGFLTAYAKGISRPNVSTLNYGTGQTIANGAVVKLGTNGEICVFVKTSANLIIDVYGYFGSSSSLTPIGPLRRLDTRSGSAPADGATQCLQITGRNGIPTTAKAIAVNLAAIAPSNDGHIQIYPDGLPRPVTSSLNYQKGKTIANNALVKPGANGKICIYTLRSTHYALDIVGYWQDNNTGDPCAGITCNNAPPPTCVGGKDLVSYAKTGSCKDGTCIYQVNTKSCSYKCVSNACVPEPPPTNVFHAVTSWQSPSQPVSSGSGMDLLALRYITIHYNGGNLDLDGRDNVYQDSDFAQILRNMQNDYVTNRGYSVGYNSAIAPDGDEWEIRGFKYRCAANGCTAVNRPAYAIICPLPSVTATPTQAQINGIKAAIARVRAAIKAAGNNNPIIINGHRDVRPLCGSGGTACPGDKLYGLIKNGTF